MASSGHNVVMVGSFLICCAAARAGKWHCQVSLVVSPVVYETLYLASRSCYKLKVICMKPQSGSAKVVNICLAKIFQIPSCNYVT